MSTTTNNGGPAFPTENEHQSSASTWHYEGMTLRDYFAAKAMQVYLAEQRKDALEIEKGESPFVTPMNDSDVAELSYGIADAMLKARSEQ